MQLFPNTTYLQEKYEKINEYKGNSNYSYDTLSLDKLVSFLKVEQNPN